MPQNYSSWLAVDGDFYTRTIIDRGPSAWWRVDLGREGLVIGARLSFDARMPIGNQRIINITVIDTPKKSYLCALIHKTYTLFDEKVVEFCDEALQGRFVQVQMSLSGRCGSSTCNYPVYLNEVDVMLGKKKTFVEGTLL